MSHPTATPARPANTSEDQVTGAPTTAEPAPDTVTPVITQDLLVEEVSIDGMCGVY